jgi:hypothetical protein
MYKIFTISLSYPMTPFAQFFILLCLCSKSKGQGYPMTPFAQFFIPFCLCSKSKGQGYPMTPSAQFFILFSYLVSQKVEDI